jgi:adenosylcobinamide kinase / adenosylcobinamide-phosphate guanylyltransferase
MQEKRNRSVTLVLGGARSGKSRFAQKLGERASAVGFIATAKAVDAEMEEKIRRHREERPSDWVTIEEPLDLARALVENAGRFDSLIVDCLTIFAANILEEGMDTAAGRVDGFLRALNSTQTSVVMVSNEAGSGVVPAYPLGRQFRDLLGELNQRAAAVADNVVLMVAGLPLVVKGEIDVSVNGRPQQWAAGARR